MKTYSDEIQVMSFKWFDKLKDATSSMFNKRKAIAEYEVSNLEYIVRYRNYV